LMLIFVEVWFVNNAKLEGEEDVIYRLKLLREALANQYTNL